MSNKREIPLQAGKRGDESRKVPKGDHINFDTFNPSWRISSFDKDGPWGLNYLLGPFVFSYSDSLISKVIEESGKNNAREAAEQLNNSLSNLDGKEFSSMSAFWEKVNQSVKHPLSLSIISSIEDCITRILFLEKIIPKLVEFEKITWTNIKEQSHMKKGSKVSNNHYISIDRLSKEAISRLEALKLNDNDQIYSLRLEGKIRIYGFRKQSSLDIVWVDYEHTNEKHEHPIYLFD